MKFNGSLDFGNESHPCDLEAENPWCGQFGTRQVLEVIYLTIVAIMGSLGNILVIASIKFKKRVHKNGNIFIINLAAADLIVTGLIIPTVIANVFESGQAIPDILCMIVGYIVTTTCVCSVCSLTCIALNRYWSVVHADSYHKLFTKKKAYLMVLFTWLWSNLVVTPTLYGWSGLGYDFKMLQCAWDDTASIAYNIILMICAIFVPFCVVSFCYYKLFLNVRSRGKWMRDVTNKSIAFSKSDSGNKKQRLLAREVNLLKTLATTVVVFVLCWVPYGFTILIDPAGAPPNAKKIVGWLGLSNSAVNFVIYGVMNKVFRRGYKDFLKFLFCCDKHKSVASAVIYPAMTAGIHVTKKKNSSINSNSYNSTHSTPLDTRRKRINGLNADMTKSIDTLDITPVKKKQALSGVNAFPTSGSNQTKSLQNLR